MSINWGGSSFALMVSSKQVTDLSHICCHPGCHGVRTSWEKACQLASPWNAPFEDPEGSAITFMANAESFIFRGPL